MTLEERIHDRIVIYQVKQDPGTALEIALYYLILAKRKNCKLKIADACAKSIYWLRKTQVEIPGHVESLSCFGQMEEIGKILVKAKVNVVEV